MDLFRQKQKLIFWIVTIIIVPSFVLVWGVDRYYGNDATMNFEVGQIGNQKINFPEFENFQKRLRAATAGMPLEFTNAPGAGSAAEDIYKYISIYSLLKDAEQAGYSASDLQVGTYLERGHPIISQSIANNPNDPQAKDRAVDALCRQMQISRADFLRGIREWQTLGNYMDADANLAPVNDELVYTYYSMNKSEIVVKRIQFPEAGAINEMAKSQILAKSEEELDTEVRDFIATNITNPRYREPAEWRFAWVLTPFVSSESVTQPSEAEIRDRYEEGRAYTYNNLPISDVRDRIKSELLQAEVERQTLRNFTVDVDSQLRSQAAEMDLQDLIKLAQLVKYGVQAGDTGEQTLASADVVKALPQTGDFQLQLFLDSIDSQQQTVRDAMIDEWKSGFNIEGRPFKGDKGFYRLRLLDYVPSKPAEIDDADGNIKPVYLERAIEDMVGVRAREIAREQALDLETKLREYMLAKETGETAPDPEVASQFEDMPTETIPYLQIAESNYQLSRLPVGDMVGPNEYVDPASGVRGQELLVMVERRVPSRETYEAEAEEVKRGFRSFVQNKFRSNYGPEFTMNGPAIVITPSPSLMGGLINRFNNGDIRVNPELLRTREG